jgi:adenylate cyclase
MADAYRKLVAVMCADVVGYSRMIGEDAEGTLTMLASHMSELIEPAIARHHGRIVKTTGDGILAEFASPVAAALAALEMQEGLRSRNAGVPEGKRQRLRIGLTLGDVMVRDGDIFGDAVNVAARLQALADPGGVYASGAVVDQLRGHIGFAWDDVGHKALKNIARPVRTFRLLRAANAPSKILGPLRGRTSGLVLGAAALLALVVIVGFIWLRLPAAFTRPESAPPASELATL